MDANMQSVLGNMHGRIGTAAYPLRVHTWSEDRVHANKQTIWNQKSMYMEELYMAKVKGPCHGRGHAESIWISPCIWIANVRGTWLFHLVPPFPLPKNHTNHQNFPPGTTPSHCCSRQVASYLYSRAWNRHVSFRKFREGNRRREWETTLCN